MPPTKKEEIERLNPKLMVRRMNALLPKLGHRDHYVQATIQSLWNHSNGFLLAEDLEAGRVHFTVNVSYSQLAQDMCCSWGAAKKRIEQLRDKWKLVTWTVNNNPKLGNDFIVDYSANEHSTTPVRPLGPAYAEPNSATEKDSLSYRESSTQLPRPRTQLPMSSSTVFELALSSTGEERTVTEPAIASLKKTEDQEQEQPLPTSNIQEVLPVDSPDQSPDSVRPLSEWEIEKQERDKEQRREMELQHRWEDDTRSACCRRCQATYGAYIDGTAPEECPGASKASAAFLGAD